MAGRKLTITDEIMRWRFGDAAERLLNGRTYSDPPDDWAAWEEPSSALPIDQTITKLKTTNRRPRLRSHAELKAQKIICPYYIARFAIAMAVDEATVAAVENPIDMTKRWRAHEVAARKAAPEIDKIAESLLCL